MDRREQRKAHWDKVYGTKGEEEVSWFQADPVRSFDMIRASGADPSAPLIDVGGGASRLVDQLLDARYTDVTVLDISAPAIDQARARLGPRAELVNWIVADVTDWHPTRNYTFWHDRAVFHFLTEAADRAAYREALELAVPPGGHAVIATFGPGGPKKCSGLPVCRYGPTEIAAEFEGLLALEEATAETHRTPAGKEQSFRFFRFRRI